MKNMMISTRRFRTLLVSASLVLAVALVGSTVDAQTPRRGTLKHPVIDSQMTEQEAFDGLDPCWVVFMEMILLKVSVAFANQWRIIINCFSVQCFMRVGYRYFARKLGPPSFRASTALSLEVRRAMLKLQSKGELQPTRWLCSYSLTKER